MLQPTFNLPKIPWLFLYGLKIRQVQIQSVFAWFMSPPLGKSNTLRCNFRPSLINHQLHLGLHSLWWRRRMTILRPLSSSAVSAAANACWPAGSLVFALRHVSSRPSPLSYPRREEEGEGAGKHRPTHKSEANDTLPPRSEGRFPPLRRHHSNLLSSCWVLVVDGIAKTGDTHIRKHSHRLCVCMLSCLLICLCIPVFSQTYARVLAFEYKSWLFTDTALQRIAIILYL